jgi:hypothetical protein
MRKEKNNYSFKGIIKIVSKESGKEAYYKYKIEESEGKDLCSKLKEVITANKFEVILIMFSVIYYLINLTYNIFKKNQFNLPFEYFKINLIEGLFYIGFLIGSPLIFTLLGKFIKVDEFNKKLLKIESIVVSFIFGMTLSLEFSNIIMLIIFLISFIVLIFILFEKSISEKIKKIVHSFYFFVYTILIGYHLIIIFSNRFEILKIDAKDKVVITIYQGRYLIMDCNIEDKELEIHKDSYNFIEINSDKIEKIQYIKFISVK